MNKRIATILSLVFILTVFSTLASANDWWDHNWGHRVEITLDADNVEQNLTDFPILVHLEDGVNANFSNINVDGSDIRFVLDNSLLDYEIEKIGSNEAFIWVELPLVSSVTDTTFQVYFGNLNATDVQNSTSVWNDDFLTVQHMEENPGISMMDSTINNHTGYSIGNMSLANNIAAIVGDGVKFDGLDDAIEFDDAIDPDNYNEGFSISFWVRQDKPTQFAQVIMWGETGSYGSTGLVFDGTTIDYYFGTGLPANYYNTPISQSSEEWIHFVMTHNTTVDRLYMDSQLVHEDASGTLAQGISDFKLAKHMTYPNYFLNGTMDELRVQKKSLTENEINLSYMSETGNLLGFGPVEEVSGLFMEGTALIGNTVKFYIYDWEYPLEKYALLASGGTEPGINLSDGRNIPLNNDDIFKTMRENSSSLGFTDANGTLDTMGRAIVTWDIPNKQSYVNETAYFAFITHNGTLENPDVIYTISEALPVLIGE